jgi:nitrite reductase (NADH) small subunit
MNDPTPDWTTVCTVDDIPMLGARRVRRDAGADVALFRVAGDRVFALLDRCPHRGGPLSQGIVFGERVACPLHNWSIGLADGAATAPDEGRTARFDVRLVGREVQLDRQALRAEAGGSVDAQASDRVCPGSCGSAPAPATAAAATSA